MKEKPLKIGFDLDGVILYNPLRAARPFVAFIKKLFFRKRSKIFLIPQSPTAKLLWRLFHKSSIFIAPGFDEIKKLVQNHQIEAYLVTARYSFLKDDLNAWLKKIGASSYFSGIYYNSQNEQPHLFKERILKDLDLDYFVEDNWNIVQYLYSVFIDTTQVLWVCNMFDKNIPYKLKFANLSQVIQYIKTKSL